MIKLFTIAILSFLYSLVFFENKPNQINVKSTKSSIFTDTSRVFYFSFPENRLMDMESANEKPVFEKMEVCQGAKVILEAPVFYANAKYYWEGPGEFRSYLPNVVLDHVSTKQSGTYKVWIENALVQTLGSISLNVNTTPIPKITQSERGKLVKFKAIEVNQGTQIFWIDPNNKSFGPKNELIISTDQKKMGDWYVLIKSRDCEYKFKI